MNSNSDLLLSVYHLSRAMAKFSVFLVHAIGAVLYFTFGLLCGLSGIDLPASPETAPTARKQTHRPPPRVREVKDKPRAVRDYEVVCDRDGEVTLNGLPIGHIDSAPWQFCSYDLDFGNGPARPTKAAAFDDASDYAESVARTA
jgi:hypothetical protein